MKTKDIAIAGLSAMTLVGSLLGGCSRNRQDAVKLSNRADQELKVSPGSAASLYDQATKLDPQNHRIFHKMAIAYEKLEEWDKVASSMARATEIAPTFANYWHKRGDALLQQAKKGTIEYTQAREPYERCIQADANYAECYNRLGTVFLWTDEEQKALENYAKAIDYDPTNVWYYADLADLYLRLGYTDNAEKVLKEAKGHVPAGDPKLFSVFTLMAQVYQDRGDAEASIKELEEAKKVAAADGPQAVVILYSLGAAYANMNPPRKQEAVQMLKGFSTRACRGQSAIKYKSECETSQTLIARMGGVGQ